MKRYWAYFKAVCRHKYFVLIARKRYGCSFWRAIAHDMSKFLPSEFIPYARCFYNKDGKGQYEEDEKFNLAWLKHQHRNKHHYQYWILKEDSGTTQLMDMPEKYIREMLADWSIDELFFLKYHFFGHIHEQGGQKREIGGRKYFNVARTTKKVHL